jgi:protein TonB
MSRQYGFIISLFIHTVILMVPVSMAVKNKIQDIELFFTVEKARNRPAPIITRKEIMQPVKEKKPETEKIEKIENPAEKPLPKENAKEITEQFILDKKPSEDAVQLKPLSLSSKVKAVTSPQAYYPKKPEKPVDTEFGSAIAPAFLHREMPQYPILARRLGKEGKVILRLIINEKGNLLNVEVVENAGYGFTEAAIAAVKKSTFLPAKKDGKPIASRALLPIKFKLGMD